MTPSVLARIALAGKGIDLLGGCYLAYDLLDGRNGPLRGITRATVYMPLFFCGYAPLLGLPFAAVAAIGMAAALAIEFTFAGAPSSPRVLPAVMAVTRGLVLGCASAIPFGWSFTSPFGLFAACGLLAGWGLGLSPAQDHAGPEKAGVRWHNVLASTYRAGSTGLSAGLAGLVAGIAHPLLTGIRIGATVGLVSALVGLFSPALEGWVARTPSRTLGVIGLCLLVVGTLLDSVHDWMDLAG